MTPIDKLIVHFRKSITLTDDEAEVVGKCFTIVELKKKEILLFVGDQFIAYEIHFGRLSQKLLYGSRGKRTCYSIRNRRLVD